MVRTDLGDRRPVDHVGGHRNCDIAHPARSDGDATSAPSPGQGREGNRVVGPSQFGPPDVRRGIGSDAYGIEYTKTGEEVDDRKRAAMLDESLEVITRAWTGEEVVHRGEHYTVDGVRFLPVPVQHPRIPIWVAGLIQNKRPRRRAARYDGYLPVFLETPDQAAEALADLQTLGVGDDFDLVVPLAPGTDPAPYVAVGAAWCVVEFPWASTSADLVRGVIREGPWV